MNKQELFETQEIVHATLSHGYFGWDVTSRDYDCEIIGSGENAVYSGSFVANGSTPEEAIENYLEWVTEKRLEDDNENPFRLEIEGWSESLEIHQWWLKKQTGST